MLVQPLNASASAGYPSDSGYSLDHTSIYRASADSFISVKPTPPRCVFESVQPPNAASRKTKMRAARAFIFSIQQMALAGKRGRKSLQSLQAWPVELVDTA